MKRRRTRGTTVWKPFLRLRMSRGQQPKNRFATANRAHTVRVFRSGQNNDRQRWQRRGRRRPRWRRVRVLRIVNQPHLRKGTVTKRNATQEKKTRQAGRQKRSTLRLLVLLLLISKRMYVPRGPGQAAKQRNGAGCSQPNQPTNQPQLDADYRPR